VEVLNRAIHPKRRIAGTTYQLAARRYIRARTSPEEQQAKEAICRENQSMSEVAKDPSTVAAAPLRGAQASADADDGRVGVLSRSFLALVATQFFVSLNDNMYRWLIVPIGKELIPKAWATMPPFIRDWTNPEALALPLGLACFTLPFLIFAAPAGFLADRFSKRKVMVGCKVAELVVIGLGITAILLGSVPLMFLMLFILGGQAMMFITSKLGAIPEIVRSDQISAANGLINMVSMAAIILGSVAGNWLYALTKPAGQVNWWISAAALFGVAGCGLLTSLFIGRLPAANPARPIPWNPAGQTWRDLSVLISKRSLFLVALGSTYFWTLGALSQANIDQFATKHLLVEQQHVGPLLAALTLGIGGGALLAGALSRGKVELGLVPIGGCGIAVMSILLAFAPGGVAGTFTVSSYAISCTLLFAMGVTAGLYDIPLQAFIQERSPPESRGSIMAAYNFLAFAGMLAASGIYWLLSGPLGLSSRWIFLVGGLATVPITLWIVRLLPFQSARFATWLLSRCLYRVTIEGVEHVPENGGALVVANHVSWADGILLGLACPQHPRMIAYAPYFDNRWIGWFGRLGRIIPLGTTRKSMAESIRLAREALQNGEIVCMFPEGEITRSGEMHEFRPGFLSILKETDAPVVPVYLGGLWGSIFSYEGGKFFWKWPKHWRYPVLIRFGQPIHAPTDAEHVRRAVEALQPSLTNPSNVENYGPR
jgi:acyl-[acyl-carrier-protein]-phospholipid O-acyltransferase / long-chain-fatty-acid--[acyl-carrier-protein] ligase